MSEYPPQSPQQAPSKSNTLHSSACSGQTSLFNSPQPSLEMNNIYFSHWESSFIHNEPKQILCESDSGQRIKAQARLTETQHDFSQYGPQQTQTCSHQDQKQSSISPSVQQGNTAGSCCTKFTLGSYKSPDVNTSASAHPGQVRAAAGFTGQTHVSNNNVLDNNTVLLSEPFTFPQPDDYQDAKDKPPSDYMGQSSNSGRSDITNKYHSFFFSGALHGYQSAEGLPSGVRPVQSCQDYTEDTSSSDDEGKLIIEL